jgi:surface protein
MNGPHGFLVPADDYDLYPLNYNEIFGGENGCEIVVNDVPVSIGPNSSININVLKINGGTGCFLGGERQNGIGRKTFFSLWNTRNVSTGSSADNQIRLPLLSNGVYKFIVEWGDGTFDKITTWNQLETTHTYVDKGFYQVRITGTCNGFAFKPNTDREKIMSVMRWGEGFRLGSNIGYFQSCINLDLSVVEDVLNLKGVTSFQDIFRGAVKITTINRINEWDVSEITSFSSAFDSAFNFNDNIGDWNTLNVTDMSFMFGNTDNNIGKFNKYIGNWNTSKVTTMRLMFYNQIDFNQAMSTKEVTVGGKTYLAWDTLNVTNMSYMFGADSGNSGKFNKYIGNWNTSKVTTMRTMFQTQVNFNQDISTKEVTVGGKTYLAWDTLNVTDMSFMIGAGNGNSGKFNQDIGNWNTSKVTTMQSMFSNQADFNQDISTKEVTVGGSTYLAWDTLNVTNMRFMVSAGNGNSGKFNKYIGNWNTSKVTTMQLMFSNQADLNQDISAKEVTVGGKTYLAWDTLNVTDMSFMFGNTDNNIGKFNKYIGNWNTSKVTTMRLMFYNQIDFNQAMSTKEVTVGGKTYLAWDTLNVTNMSYMFGADSGNSGKFNKYIGNWNTSKVTTMRTMFQTQVNFNQDISTKEVTVGGKTYLAWDTLNVTDMSFMIGAGNGNSGKFNQDIGNWNTSKVTTMQSMFSNQADFNQDISTKEVTVGGSTYLAWDTLNVTNMRFMVSAGNGNSGKFNKYIGNWNTSKVTTMQLMFSNQADLNQDISAKEVTVGGKTYLAWDTLNVTDMSFMLSVDRNIGKFNQDIGNWNTSKITTMEAMFQNQIDFNQDISNFNVSLTDFDITLNEGFMLGKSSDNYSTTNYDNLLIVWSSRPVKPNVLINFGTIKNTYASEAAKLILINEPNNWTIIDGGLSIT